MRYMIMMDYSSTKESMGSGVINKERRAKRRAVTG